jgi:hypothetical protein
VSVARYLEANQAGVGQRCATLGLANISIPKTGMDQMTTSGCRLVVLKPSIDVLPAVGEGTWSQSKDDRKAKGLRCLVATVPNPGKATLTSRPNLIG